FPNQGKATEPVESMVKKKPVKSQASVDEQLSQQRSVPVHMIKSQHFRVTHCDGAFGGITPDRKSIHVCLFNTRAAIPTEILYAVNEQGEVSNEISRTTRGGLVRELEIDVVFDPDTAETVA